MPPLRSDQSSLHTGHQGNFTSPACFVGQQRKKKWEVVIDSKDGRRRDCERCMAAGIECSCAGKRTKNLFRTSVVGEKMLVGTVVCAQRDGGRILQENGLREDNNDVLVTCSVPLPSAIDVDSIEVELKVSGSVFSDTSSPLHFSFEDARSAKPTVPCTPGDVTYPPPPHPTSPHHRLSDIVNSGPQRSFAQSQTALFNSKDLESVRRIIAPQENRRPLRDHARDRPQNQPRSTQVSAPMGIQKPLPLPGGPPSLPFQGKSNGARKRRLRREAREAEQSIVEEGLR